MFYSIEKKTKTNIIVFSIEQKFGSDPFCSMAGTVETF